MDSTGDVRVVIADDDAAMRMALRLLVGAQPGLVIVGEASNGRTLEQLVGRESPDVLIVDFGMPGMQPAIMVPRLVHSQPQMRTIVLSGLEVEETRQATGDLPGVTHVQKGRDMAELVHAIRSVAAQVGTPR